MPVHQFSLLFWLSRSTDSETWFAASRNGDWHTPSAEAIACKEKFQTFKTQSVRRLGLGMIRLARQLRTKSMRGTASWSQTMKS